MALKVKKTSMRIAQNIYGRSPNPFPHYIIGNDGDTVQVCREEDKAWHAGVTDADRELYLSGKWVEGISMTGLDLWRARWPGVKSPSHIYPGRSPNDCYIGIELIPLLEMDATNRTLYTPVQYSALAKLLADIAARHHIELKGSRLIGHEDIEPLQRWASPGGWDPGALRTLRPHFKWELVKI